MRRGCGKPCSGRTTLCAAPPLRLEVSARGVGGCSLNAHTGSFVYISSATGIPWRRQEGMTWRHQGATVVLLGIRAKVRPGLVRRHVAGKEIFVVLGSCR